jgi:hypothetical protein
VAVFFLCLGPSPGGNLAQEEDNEAVCVPRLDPLRRASIDRVPARLVVVIFPRFSSFPGAGFAHGEGDEAVDMSGPRDDSFRESSVGRVPALLAAEGGGGGGWMSEMRARVLR